MSLYGDMTPQVGEIIGKIPKKAGAIEAWCYFGKFLFEYFKEYHENFDQTVVDEMIGAIKNQNHSGGSIGVVTQELFKYLSGNFSDEQRKVVRSYKK